MIGKWRRVDLINIEIYLSARWFFLLSKAAFNCRDKIQQKIKGY